MFKNGDTVRVLSNKELISRYAQKNKLSTEQSKVKIDRYCYSYRRGLVMKKNERPFSSLDVCGKEGKISNIILYKDSDSVSWYHVVIKVEQLQWTRNGDRVETIFINRTYVIPPSCLMFPDFQMEFIFD